jgi:hypothetical protein
MAELKVGKKHKRLKKKTAEWVGRSQGGQKREELSPHYLRGLEGSKCLLRE